MQRIKGKSARKLWQEYSHLKRQCWGRYLWVWGFFVASSGNITDEMIMEYIESQDIAKENEEFKVEDPWSGFQPTFEPTSFQPVAFSLKCL